MTEPIQTSCCEILEAFYSIFKKKFGNDSWKLSLWDEKNTPEATIFNRLSYSFLLIRAKISDYVRNAKVFDALDNKVVAGGGRSL